MSKQQSWFPSQSLPPAAPASHPVGLGGPPRSNILPQGLGGQNIASSNQPGANLYLNPVRDMAQGSAASLPIAKGQPQGYPDQRAQHPPARMGQALPSTPYGYNTPTTSPWAPTPDQIARRNYPVGSRSGLFGRSQPKVEREHYPSLKAFIDSRYAKQEPFVKEYLWQMEKDHSGIDNHSEARISQTTRMLLQKEKAFVDYFIQKYGLLNQNGFPTANRLTWNQLADITDFVAQNTSSDEEFRLQLWIMFGTKIHAPLNQFVDPTNKGLPKQYHNTKKPTEASEEQFHHYLGGVTGDLNHSHLYNNHIVAPLVELDEILKRGLYNWGDVNLFTKSQEHRDAFILHGRYTVGPNIRRLLKGQ